MRQILGSGAGPAALGLVAALLGASCAPRPQDRSVTHSTESADGRRGNDARGSGETRSFGDTVRAPDGPPAAPNLRALTVVVQPSQPSVLAEAVRKLSHREAQLGESWAQAVAKSFGSGALFTVGSGRGGGVSEEAARVFVVTNRHVIGHAEVAHVSSPSVDPAVEARVVFVDPQYDLAVLEFPGPLPVGAEAFPLRADTVHDQDEVVASGYPGISGEPSYQVSRGYVSNELVMIREMSDRPYIQHTAPIDPGSSGGPLVSTRGTLVGINTLKLREREAVGMAIPAEAVVEALKAVLGGAAAEERSACERLAAVVSVGEPSLALVHLLSAGMLAEHGPSSLVWLGSDPGWRERFVAHPDFVLGIALAARVWQSVTGGDTAGKAICVATHSTSGRGQYALRFGARNIPVSFVAEQQTFKLAGLKLSGPSGYGFLERKTPRTRAQGWKPQLR